MEQLPTLDAEATQAFLDRIAEQASYNYTHLPEFETKALAFELDASRCQSVGSTALSGVSPYDSHKFPAAESVAESTQEMAIPVLPETTLVAVRTVRLSADPRLVPFGEDPRKYPVGNRQRFFLADVID